MTDQRQRPALDTLLLLEPDLAIRRLHAAGFTQVQLSQTQGWRPGQLPRVVQITHDGDTVHITVALFPALGEQA